MKNILDEAMPDHDNDPTNYVLLRSSPRFYGIFYKPTNTVIIFRWNMDFHRKVTEYLLSQKVEVFEGNLPEFQEAYWGQNLEDDNSS